jgi:hypothetical protein
VFTAAISMISDDDFDSEEAIVSTIFLSGFLNEKKILDEQSWLPQPFAIALILRKKISENDVRIMLSVNPMAMDRLSKKEFALMISLLREIREDPEVFLLRGQKGRCALHLVGCTIL